MEIFLKIAAAVVLLIVLILGGYFFCCYQNNHLVVSAYEYLSEKVDSKLRGFKILQISDLHNKEFGAGQNVIIEKVREQKPDIIVITGDFIDDYNTELQPALDFIEKVADIAPVYYISGNHEQRIDWRCDLYKELLEGMKNYGVKIVNNKVEKVFYDNDSYFYLIGMDAKNVNAVNLKKLTEKLDDSRLKVLLSHFPDCFYIYAEANVDLVFTGHAHGGQIRLPFTDGLYAPGQGFLPKLTSGMHTKDNTSMIISRGLGNSAFPVRMFNQPEIVVTALK